MLYTSSLNTAVGHYYDNMATGNWRTTWM